LLFCSYRYFHFRWLILHFPAVRCYCSMGNSTHFLPLPLEHDTSPLFIHSTTFYITTLPFPLQHFVVTFLFLDAHTIPTIDTFYISFKLHSCDTFDFVCSIHSTVLYLPNIPTCSSIYFLPAVPSTFLLPPPTTTTLPFPSCSWMIFIISITYHFYSFTLYCYLPTPLHVTLIYISFVPFCQYLPFYGDICSTTDLALFILFYILPFLPSTHRHS